MQGDSIGLGGGGGQCLGMLKDRGSVAEWSKALVLGTSLKRRGFESRRCHRLFTTHSDSPVLQHSCLPRSKETEASSEME